jgi:hypothetical protein
MPKVRIKMAEIKIIDIIHHKNKYGTQVFHILNRMPELLYERDGRWLIGEDSGFFNFYFYERPGPTWKAFAGRKFDIPMKNGTIEHAHGQWWDKMHPEYIGLLTSVGISTPERLGKCNVFVAMWADTQIVRHTINPSNNYHKYDKRSPDFGKHTIESKWK